MSNRDGASDRYAQALNHWHAGRLREADAGFTRALAATPDDWRVHLALASLCLEVGEPGRAAAVLGTVPTAAAAQPGIRLARGRVALANADPATALAELRPLARAPPDPVLRAEALLLLGLAEEAGGDDRAAFAMAAAGKRAQRALHAAQAGSREGEVAKLVRIGDWLRTAPLDWQAPLPIGPVPGAAATHCFLLGFPRSGTTLLEQLLAAHPAVRTLEEEPTLAAATNAFLGSPAACADLLRLGADEAAAWAAHYWQTVAARTGALADRCFVDKQPAGTLLLPLIARLFPDARILFAVRDPRDVVLSCFRQPFRLNAMTYAFTDLGEAAHCYAACMALAETARARLPLAWRDARHEALAAADDQLIAQLFGFLQLPPLAAMPDLAAAARGRPIRTPSAAQVRAGLNRQGVGRWRRFADELAPVLPVLSPWVERFGYAP